MSVGIHYRSGIQKILLFKNEEKSQLNGTYNYYISKVNLLFIKSINVGRHNTLFYLLQISLFVYLLNLGLKLQVCGSVRQNKFLCPIAKRLRSSWLA